MDEKYISITEICSWHQIEEHFIYSLNEVGLVEIIKLEDQEVLTAEQIRELEKMIRMHYELDINVEGIDAVYNLLNQVNRLQDEVRLLKNKLRKYED